jgi:hypothetical protein
VVLSTAPKSLSRLRRISRWRLMVMRSSSLERRRSSSAHKSVVARLAARTANDVRGATGERECVTDGTGVPPRRFVCSLREAAY